MQFGNPIAGISTTQASVDLLMFNSALAIVANTPTQVGPAAAIQHSYSTLWVEITTNTGSVVPGNLTVGAIASGGFFPAQTQPYTVAGPVATLTFLLPIAAQIGQQVGIIITSTTNINAVITIYGLTTEMVVEVINPPNTPLNVTVSNASIPVTISTIGLVRSDGRTYPLGTHSGTGTLAAANGPVTVVAAPGAGNHILLRSASILAGAMPALSSAKIQGTVNGVVSTIIGLGADTSQLALEWESGLLMDANTALVIQGAAAPTAIADVLYDVAT